MTRETTKIRKSKVCNRDKSAYLSLSMMVCSRCAIVRTVQSLNLEKYCICTISYSQQHPDEYSFHSLRKSQYFQKMSEKSNLMKRIFLNSSTDTR